MKAVVHSKYGNPEVLQVTTLERSVPQKNEVLIRVKAAGLDFGQWHLHFGAHVAAVCSTSKVEFVRSLGATSVIDCLAAAQGSRLDDSCGSTVTAGRNLDRLSIGDHRPHESA